MNIIIYPRILITVAYWWRRPRKVDCGAFIRFVLPHIEVNVFKKGVVIEPTVRFLQPEKV